jgi:iron complex outermembrane receptor protein
MPAPLKIFSGLVIFAVFSLFPTLVAQTAITGRVTIEETGKPLYGANVFVSDTAAGTISGEDGSYLIHVKTPGVYTVTVSYLGYEKAVKQVRVKAGQTARADFSMKAVPVDLEGVEVTGSQEGFKVLTEPRRIHVIRAESIRDNPGQNLISVLDYVPGVNTSSDLGIFSNSNVVSMRGLSGNDQGRTLVLLDGVPLNKADQGSVNWNRINQDNIGAIRVTKGPGPARYGSNAMGGVIELTSKEPVKDFAGNADASFGTFETFRTRYGVSGKVAEKPGKGTLRYGLSGFYTHSKGYNPEIPEYLEKGDTFQVNTNLREVEAAGKLTYKKNGHRLEGGVEIYNDKRGRGIQVYETGGSFEKHDTYQGRLNYKGRVKKAGIELGAYWIREEFRRLNEYMSDGEYNLYLVESARGDLGFSAACTYSPDSVHNFSGGVEVRQGTVHGEDIYYTSTDLITNEGRIGLYAAFIQDEIRLAGDKLLLNLGLRCNLAAFRDGSFTAENPSYSVEYLQNFQDTLIPESDWSGLDPKISLQYLHAPGKRIYMSVAKGFRAPILDDLCRSGKRSGGFKISNPFLGPENIYTAELGLDHRFDEKLDVSVSAYYSVGLDFMYYIRTGDSVNMGYKLAPIYQKNNISEVHIGGAELDLEYHPLKEVGFFCAYTWSSSRIARFDSRLKTTPEDLEGKHLVDIPDHKVVAGCTWKNRIASAGILWKTVGRQWMNDTNEKDEVLGYARYPSFSTLSFRIWHVFMKKLTVAFSMENVFDEVYINNNYQRSPGRIIMAEVGYDF